MGLVRWELPTSLRDVVEVVKRLRDLQGRLGRTPVYGASRIVTANTSVVDSDDLLLVATAGGAVTVTLPDASKNLGRRFTVKKTDASANNVVIDATELIDGAGNVTFNTQWTSYTVQSVVTAAPATFGYMIVAKGLL